MATCHHLSGATWRRHYSVTVGQPLLDHRSTVVNGGSQQWSTMVNTAGPPINGGGQRQRTTVDRRLTTGQLRPPVTTTVFTATTPENTPFAYCASTSANPNPMISLAFIQGIYEVLKSLLRERRRQIRNEDLRNELEYFSENYNKEREMEPRPGLTRKITPPLRSRSLEVRRQRERVVGFGEAPNREGSRARRNAKGGRPSKIKAREKGNRGINLPPTLGSSLGKKRK
ncbi:hypothetical protein Tco_0668353 [Tanacetum coccineum]